MSEPVDVSELRRLREAADAITDSHSRAYMDAWGDYNDAVLASAPALLDLAERAGALEEMWANHDATTADALRAERDALRAALAETSRLLTVYIDRILSPSERVMARGDVLRRARDEAQRALAPAPPLMTDE